MTTLYNISLILLSLYVFVQVVNFINLLVFTPDESSTISDEDLPSVSIMVAARNEESNIQNCLKALNALNYPKDKLKILIGDDHSEDNTFRIAENFAKHNPHFEIVSVTSQLGRARGKANVLAHLAHKATGEFYLITDADVSVNKNWARELIGHFEPETGIISGTTIVEDIENFGRMQEIDWLYFMGILKSFSIMGLNCTAVGNNMAIRQQAYWQVGGYENLDFSITEDYKLYKEVCLRGWKTKTLLNAPSTNRSKAVRGFMTLMHQRKRWLTGARELPFYWWIFFSLFGLFIPTIIIVFLFNVKLALIFYLIRICLQTTTIYVLHDKIKGDKTIDYLFAYELYSVVIISITPLFYLLPIKLRWKNRSY